jgi:hypothetical protein
VAGLAAGGRADRGRVCGRRAGEAGAVYNSFLIVRASPRVGPKIGP